jgi:hypothetical protein
VSRRSDPRMVRVVKGSGEPLGRLVALVGVCEVDQAVAPHRDHVLVHLLRRRVLSRLLPTLDQHTPSGLPAKFWGEECSHFFLYLCSRVCYAHWNDFHVLNMSLQATFAHTCTHVFAHCPEKCFVGKVI